MSTATNATAVRDAQRVPVRRLTVLYDADCPLCTFIRHWLARQRQLVPLDLVPVGSDEARRRFPGLDQAAAAEEVTVVADGGQIYRDAAAWIVCLWALSEHRPLAHRLATPAGARLARGAVLTAAKWREGYRGGAAKSGGGPGGWGGGVYSNGDGWTYHPRQGWTYTAPTCADDGCATR